MDVMEISGDDLEASGNGSFQQRSSLDPIALGAGAGAAFLVLLIGVLVVVVIAVMRRRKGRRGEWSVPGMDSHYKGKKGLEAGVTNALYDCKFIVIWVSGKIRHTNSGNRIKDRRPFVLCPLLRGSILISFAHRESAHLFAL